MMPPDQTSLATDSGAEPAVPRVGAAPLSVADGAQRATDLSALRHVPMTVQIELGRATMTLGEILDELDVGASVRLQRQVGEPVDVYVNGALFARAEVVVMQDQIGAKIVEVVDSARSLGLADH